MSTIFTKIIQGKIPCEKILENDQFFSFMDIRPIVSGHVLVIPKVETDYFFDLSDDVLGNIMVFSRPIAKAIKQAIPCERVGVMVAGLEVPHAHMHLVPISNISELSFANSRPADMDLLKCVANKIRKFLPEK